ncbi:hemin uptake protein HemP [uncultured Hoeflea sp.]|uniref:hemin uptake protein HemP n=1 Tax=uncultured Hoeflea sp. TaxID=538666 RepID=UPI0030DB4412
MENNSSGHSSLSRDIEFSKFDRVIESRSLFGESREVAIEHDGAIYRLKITKQGKLILNK